MKTAFASLLLILLKVIPFLKALWLKLFLTTRLYFPFNFAGLPPTSGLPGSAGSQPGNEGFVLVARVNLSSAQLLALLATPVTIVPAPGVGFQIVMLAAVLRFFGGTVAYTDVGGAVQFVVGGQVLALASNALFLVTVAPNRRLQTFVSPGATGVAANPPTEDNAPLQINKIANNFAAGNGTAVVEVYYTLEPTT